MVKHRISEQQLLEGPITPVLIKLAIPLIIAFGFQTSYKLPAVWEPEIKRRQSKRPCMHSGPWGLRANYCDTFWII